MTLARTCPGCGRDHNGDLVQAGAKYLAWTAHARARELGTVPGVVARPPALRVQVYRGGVRQASRADYWSGSLADFAVELAHHAELVLPDKSRATYYVDALTSGGGRRDRDVELVTGRTLDADGVPGCDWFELRAALKRCGLGSVLERSSSHTPAAPKWHALIPFARPIRYTGKTDWRAYDAWLVGYFSGLACMPGVGKDYGAVDEQGAPLGRLAPACGLDLKSKSGPGQPVYMAARRDPDQAPPAVVLVEGGALNLREFLRATGFLDAREAWQRRELETERQRRPRSAMRSAAGGSGAHLRDLGPELLARAEAWASAHRERFAGCRDRHRVILALGGVLGSAGASPGVAFDLGELLDPGRGRSARTSAENAREGRQTYTLSSVRAHLGPAAALELVALVEAMAPGAPARGPAPAVTADDHAAFVRRALTDPDHGAYLDRLPTGSGKTHHLAQAVAELGDDERLLVCADSHAFAEELAERLGPRVARVPELTCDEGREAEYQRAAANGWNPARVVCGTCPRRSKRAAKAAGLLPCSWRAERDAAWSAPVVIAQKAHLATAGFWEGAGADFARVVLEEDPVEHLASELRVTGARVARFRAALAKASEWAERAEALAKGDHEARAEAQAQLAYLDLVDNALTTLWSAAEGEGRVATVELDAEARLQLAEGRVLRDLEGALSRAAEAVETKAEPVVNLLPALAAVARPDARPVLRVSAFGSPALLVTDAAPIPADRGVLVLDATGHRPSLERVLGRAVVELVGRVERDVELVQVADSLWSRNRLWPRGEDGARELDLEQLDKLAEQVAALVERQQAQRVGVVSYKALVDHEAGAPLLEAIGRRLPRPVVFDALWFGATRGVDRLKGADLVLVIGTPSVPPSAVQRRALLLGAGADDLGAQAELEYAQRGSVAVKVPRFPPGPMRDAEEALVGAELAQAVGRGARGDWSPPGGVWVWSSHDWPSADPVRVTRARDELLAAGDSAAVRAGRRFVGNKGVNPDHPSRVLPRDLVRVNSRNLVADAVAVFGSARAARLLGVDARTVRRWLDGSRQPAPDLLARLLELAQAEREMQGA